MASTEVLTPRDLAELAAALGRATTNTRLLAGGTDLVISLRAAGRAPDLLIDLSGLRELAFVRLESARPWLDQPPRGGAGRLGSGPALSCEREEVHIGAMTTFAQLQSDATLLSLAGCLAHAAAQVGSLQIRNAATIGGNVANASPCGDTIPVLLVLDAQVQVLDAEGRITRRPLRDIVSGAGENSLAPGEAIISFSFTPLAAHQRSAFAKVGIRSTVTVARLSAALMVDLDPQSRRILAAKAAFGALGAVAFRDAGVESALCGQFADQATAQAFARACVGAVRRSIPGRASLPYKQHAMLGLAYDVWNALQVSAPCAPAWPADCSPQK